MNPEINHNALAHFTMSEDRPARWIAADAHALAQHGDNVKTIISASNFFPPNSPHILNVRGYAMRFVEEWGIMRASITRCLQQRHIRIDLRVKDSELLDARSSVFEPYHDHWYITMPLGWVPRAYALVTRINSFDNPTILSPMHWLLFKDWEPDGRYEEGAKMGFGFSAPPTWGDTVGITLYNGCSDAHLDDDRDTLDCLHLALFHEIAHGMLGHLTATAERCGDPRVDEAAADWCAGSLFVKFVEANIEQITQGRRARSSVERLSRAALVLSCVVQWAQNNSTGYHSPKARHACFLEGGYQAMYGETRTRRLTFKRQCQQESQPIYQILEFYGKKGHKFWQDDSLESDFDDYQRHTKPQLLQQLKGAFQASGLPWMQFGPI